MDDLPTTRDVKFTDGECRCQMLGAVVCSHPSRRAMRAHGGTILRPAALAWARAREQNGATFAGPNYLSLRLCETPFEGHL